MVRAIPFWMLVFDLEQAKSGDCAQEPTFPTLNTVQTRQWGSVRLGMRLPWVVRLLWNSAREWIRDDVPRLGASVAYYTLFAIAPILVLAIAIAGAFLGREAVSGEIQAQLQGLIGRQGAAALQELIKGASREHAGPIRVIAGTLALLLTSTGAFLELQHALNKIFEVKTKAPTAGKIKALVKARIISFGLVVSTGFILLVSLVLSAFLAGAARWMSQQWEGLIVLWTILNSAVSLAITTLLFALIYRALPDVRLKWRDVWVGGLITAVLFTLGKQLIGAYLGQSNIASTYGAAGSVMILLLWVYYSAQIVLYGAEMTRQYASHREGRKPRPTEVAVKDPTARPSETMAAKAR